MNDIDTTVCDTEATFTSGIRSNQEQTQNHPDLENVYFINRLGNKNQRIYPNGAPIAVDNDLFTGKLLIMIRTCDADEKEEPQDTGGTASNDIVSNYLRKKKRRFEIQFQFKFKKAPDSQLFLSCGYEDPVQLSLLSKTSLGAAMKFCKMKNPTFCYSLSGKENASEEDKKEGNYENPHFSFPIETSLDRIVITKEGEKPPTLGGVIEEDPQARKRWKINRINYNTSDTYTVCVWSTYVDFVSWKAVNLPAVPRFSLAHVNDAQPMIVQVYSVNSTDGSGKHLQKDLEIILDVEASHYLATKIGHGAKQWLEENGEIKSEDDSCSLSYHTAIGAWEEQKTKKKCCCWIR